MRLVLSLLTVLFLLFSLIYPSEAKKSVVAKKKPETKPVSVNILSKDGKKLYSEKGLIDSKGIVTTKCSLIIKYLKEVETVLIVKADDGKLLSPSKMLFCNLKNEKAAFHTQSIKLAQEISMLSIESIEEKPEKIEDTYNELDWFQKGLEYQKSKNFKKAEYAFQQAIRLKPDFYEAYINLGNVYFILGNYNEAIDSYNYALKNNHNNTLYNKIGTAYFILGDYDKAIDAYKKAVNTGQTSPETHFNLGLLYFLAGNNEEAFNEYVKLTKVNVELAESLFDLLYR